MKLGLLAARLGSVLLLVCGWPPTLASKVTSLGLLPPTLQATASSADDHKVNLAVGAAFLGPAELGAGEPRCSAGADCLTRPYGPPLDVSRRASHSVRTIPCGVIQKVLSTNQTTNVVPQRNRTLRFALGEGSTLAARGWIQLIAESSTPSNATCSSAGMSHHPHAERSLHARCWRFKSTVRGSSDLAGGDPR